jgi:hypothetical protein
MGQEYEFIDKLPHDTDVPETELPPAVGMVLASLPPPKQFNWIGLVSATVIFAIMASPIVDRLFGKRFPWYVVLFIKIFFFSAIYGTVVTFI